jgi:hypothetical protein
MKNLSKILLLALVIALVLPACKKYPEGPTVSFRSKTARLVNQWKVVQELENGHDNTTSFTNYYKNEVVEFKDNGDFSNTFTNPGDTTITWTGKWEFSKDKTKVNIIYPTLTYSWDILMLKNDELWLKLTLGTNFQEIHYETK